jgi:hypothetical protein
MFRRSTLVFCLLASSVSACSAQTDAEEQDGEAVDALTASSVTSFTVNLRSGFVPPPPPGGCIRSGRWTVDFAARRIDGTGCVGGRPGTAARALTNAEIAKIRTAIANVRTAARPAACPTDAPSTSLQIKRGTRTYDYVDQRSSCVGPARPVTNNSLAALVTEMDALTSITPAPAGATTCDGSPCFSLKGECIDSYPTGRTSFNQPTSEQHESFANITVSYVPGAEHQLEWVDDGAVAASRATQRLGAWLRNYSTILADGESRGMTINWDGPHVDVFVTATKTADAIELEMRTKRGTGSSWCKLTTELL